MRVNMVEYFLYIYEYGTLKPVEVILRRGRDERENNGRDEPNWGTLYVTYIEMSHVCHIYFHIWKCHNETPLYN
jgi:hypothetical protein